jgi:hypothetical protein
MASFKMTAFSDNRFFTALYHRGLSSLSFSRKVNMSRYAMQRKGGEKIQLPLILDLGCRCGEWSASGLDLALPPGKGLQVRIE